MLNDDEILKDQRMTTFNFAFWTRNSVETKPVNQPSKISKVHAYHDHIFNSYVLLWAC